MQPNFLLSRVELERTNKFAQTVKSVVYLDVRSNKRQLTRVFWDLVRFLFRQELTVLRAAKNTQHMRFAVSQKNATEDKRDVYLLRIVQFVFGKEPVSLLKLHLYAGLVVCAPQVLRQFDRVRVPVVGVCGDEVGTVNDNFGSSCLREHQLQHHGTRAQIVEKRRHSGAKA